MSTPLSGIASAPARFSLTARLGILLAVLAGETLLASYFVQLSMVSSLAFGAALVHQIQHWLFRFIIAYAISLAMLGYLRANVYAAAAAMADRAPSSVGWALVHVALLAPYLYLSALIYAGASAIPFAALALAWHGIALAAILALFAALAPLGVWRNVVRQTQGLPFYAILPAAAAVAAIKASQLLWAPAARVTFHIVRAWLHPLVPGLHSDPSSLILGTNRFAVQISEQCSGLEGIGLLLAFSAGWLWLFRRDYYFPRALLVVPVGVLIIFLLNAVRIGTIVLIGNAGYGRVAMLGFHSQAGWIGFNLTAFGIAILAHRSPWLCRVADRKRGATAYPAGTEAAAMSLTGAGQASAGFTRAGVANVSVTGAGLTNTGLTEAGVADASFTSAGLASAGLASAGLTGAGLTGASLTGASLTGAGLTHAGLSSAGLPADAHTAASDPTAAYLIPLLAILAAGMISHALSAGFEFLYPLRLAAALAALWVYRRCYADADRRFTWRGPVVGALMFVLWVVAAALLLHPAGAPAALNDMSGTLRAGWIACRVLAAMVTVPIAEELAYRGYLLRRLVSPRFEAVAYSSARWAALLVSALAFGLMHGALWLPGIAAGLAYGALAVRTNKLGESIAAHATTNALLAAYVLASGQWQLW